MTRISTLLRTALPSRCELSDQIQIKDATHHDAAHHASARSVWPSSLESLIAAASSPRHSMMCARTDCGRERGLVFCRVRLHSKRLKSPVGLERPSLPLSLLVEVGPL